MAEKNQLLWGVRKHVERVFLCGCHFCISGIMTKLCLSHIWPFQCVRNWTLVEEGVWRHQRRTTWWGENLSPLLFLSLSSMRIRASYVMRLSGCAHTCRLTSCQPIRELPWLLGTPVLCCEKIQSVQWLNGIWRAGGHENGFGGWVNTAITLCTIAIVPQGHPLLW